MAVAEHKSSESGCYGLPVCPICGTHSGRYEISSRISFSRLFSVENLFLLSFLIRCYKFSFFFHSLHNFTDDVDGVFSRVAHLSTATEHGND